MFRTFRHLAIILVSIPFFFCAAGTDVLAGGSSSQGLTITTSAPTIGHDVEMAFGGSQHIEGATVYFFQSDNKAGTTTVTVGSHTLSIPMSNATLFDTGTVNQGSVRSCFRLPKNEQLIGQDIYFIAVVVHQNQAIPSLRMPSGPILGDDIA